MEKLTVIGYSSNGIYVGSANAESMDEATHNATAWLKGSRIATVHIYRAGQPEPVAVMGLQR